MSKHDEETKPKKPLIQDRDHPLRTRRDFLAQGLLASAGSLLLPWSSRALAACDVSSMAALDDPMIPVIAIELAGGSNIAGSNIIVGKPGGQMSFLSDYSSLGLDSTRNPSVAGMVNTELGLAFHSQSTMLAGIQSVTTTAMRSKVDGLLFCCSSNDDTDNNQINPMHWFHKAGATGKITQLIGNTNTLSGARSQAPATSVDVTVRPLKISRPSDITNLIGLGARAESFTSTAQQRTRLLDALNQLHATHLKSLTRRQMSDSIKDLVICNSQKTQTLLASFTTTQVNPSTDASISTAFPNLANDGTQQTAASVAKMVLDGLAASGTITMGGYDYHSGNRTDGDAADRLAGEVIGRLIQAASLKNKPLVIYVYTDGGVAARNEFDPNNGKLVWSGDSGERSASFMLVFNPSGKVQIRNTARQIGGYKEGGSNDNNATPASNSVVNVAKAVVLNYLALHGMEGQFEATVADNPFGSLDPYIFFGKIA